MEDLELIRRLSENDPLAFRILVEKYQDMVFRTSMGLLHDKEEAEDISQEVFIEVFKSIGYFRGESEAFNSGCTGLLSTSRLMNLKRFSV